MKYKIGQEYSLKSLINDGFKINNDSSTQSPDEDTDNGNNEINIMFLRPPDNLKLYTTCVGGENVRVDLAKYLKFTPNQLEEFAETTGKILSRYERAYGLKFGKVPALENTPEKPNSARALVPVTYDDYKIGDMVVAAFRQEDGTGDTSAYQHGQLIIPEEYQVGEKQERIYPRSKEGVRCEGFFPLFSTSKNETHLGMVSLEELTVTGENPPVVTKAWDLGMEPELYRHCIETGSCNATPRIQYTLTHINGERVGDPHAIFNASDASYVQVVGFLAIKENSPILHEKKLFERMTRAWKFGCLKYPD